MVATKFDWDSFDDAEGGTSFDWGAYETVKPKKGGAEKAARIGAQYGLGLADRAMLPLTLQAAVLNSPDAQHAEFRKGIFEDIERLAEQKQTGAWDEKDEALFQELQEQIKHPEKAEPFVKTADISPSALLRKGVEKTTGYDLKPEGAAEHIAEFAGSFTPKEIGTGIKNLPKLLPKSIKEKLPSGLTKPKAVDSKLTRLAIGHPDKQAKAIESLEKEAGVLAKKSVEKSLPISKKIEEGFDFAKDHERRFAALKHSAEKYNPTIDITPVSDFLRAETQQYRGIPQLHAEGKKVMSEIKALRSKPQTELKNLLKIFRSNNQKRTSIAETKFVKGKQTEYANFLKNLNSKIEESIGNTLPQDSAWLKEFKDTNKQYSQFLKSKDALKSLDSVLRGKATPARLEKLAYDKIAQKKLAMTMGEQGAQEIAQIAKDLSIAKAAIKKMPAKVMKEWEKLLLIGLIIPGTHGIAPVIGAYKGIELGRRGLGWLLSRPSTRKQYQLALKAIINDDKKAYVAAATSLANSLNEEGEE